MEHLSPHTAARPLRVGSKVRPALKVPQTPVYCRSEHNAAHSADPSGCVVADGFVSKPFVTQIPLRLCGTLHSRSGSSDVKSAPIRLGVHSHPPSPCLDQTPNANR